LSEITAVIVPEDCPVGSGGSRRMTPMRMPELNPGIAALLLRSFSLIVTDSESSTSPALLASLLLAAKSSTPAKELATERLPLNRTFAGNDAFPAPRSKHKIRVQSK
jgi:hypothetical protein